MRICSALGNILILLCCLLYSTHITAQEQSSEYELLMNIRSRTVTSICMIDTQSDGSMIGTVVSEMGAKAFDFTYQNGNARVINLMGPLNKWYIKKMLNKDFSFILSNMSSHQTEVIRKARHFTRNPQGEIHMENLRYKIYYTFTPMVKKNETHQ